MLYTILNNPPPPKVSPVELKAQLQAQLAAIQQQQNAAQAQETQLLATVEFPNVVATTYDPTGRTITI